MKFACVFLAAVLLLVSQAWGQAGSSTIRGVVTDQTGAVVPGATVTITNVKTSFTRSQAANEVGAFTFDLIPPGDYNLEITSQGFKKKIVTPVQALVGLPTATDVQLEVGNVADTVTVEATSTAVQVNTTDATLGNNFVNQQIIHLPLEARNVAALLTLQPGVTGAPGAVGFVAGARSDQSNITLDGIDINDQQTSQLDDAVLRLNSEAVEEFRVTTVNANANQGRSSAAQINLVTKSGTNELHGSAFWFHRSTGFTANDFFNNRAGVDRPALIRNTFGGSIGGPIAREKLFFFYAFDGLTDASGQIVVRQVPLPHLGQGEIRYRDNVGAMQTLNSSQLNMAFPEVGINSAAMQALAAAASAYPSNDNTAGDNINTGGFRFNAPANRDLNNNVGKIDWIVNGSQTLSARANFIYDLANQAPQFPDTPAPNVWSHPWGGVINHNWTIGSAWVNNFRYGYTRMAFSQQGDSVANNISFRFIFSPLRFLRALDRTTPVHNIVNDTSWVRGKHSINFGTNMRITRNSRVNLANAFDTAVTNPTFYNLSGAGIMQDLNAWLTGAGLPTVSSQDDLSVRDSSTALIGRLSQYSARFTFDSDGSLLSPATPTDRTFATEEYDLYIQDSWRWRRNLTITAGLRYGLSRPVYEVGGFEVKPSISSDDYFRMRLESAAQGIPFNDPLILDLSGPSNDRSPLYRWDRNNFQPRIAVAWSPSFESPWLTWIFGSQGKTSFRGGYAMVNDYYGQALAVQFDLANTLGFTSNTTLAANTYDITTSRMCGAAQCPLAPQFTGFDMQIRPLPGITVPTGISFPQQQPSNNARRIESGVDEGLNTPYNHVWNFSIERELPFGMVVQTNYTGRLGRDLLAQRDIMALNNLVDPISGMDWYTAAGMLESIRNQIPTSARSSFPITSVAAIPYFENMFNPSTLGGSTLAQRFGASYAGLNATQVVFRRALLFDRNDWTFTQHVIDVLTGVNFFFNPQYGALSAWGTVGNSNYHGGSLTVRQRYRGLIWDFNYTMSHSFDDGSALQAAGQFSGAGFILNPIRQKDFYAPSGFDIRHQINVTTLYELPFGRGKAWGSGVNRGVDALIGGWQLSGIFRWNTGLPVSVPFDGGRWATNWNLSSRGTLTREVKPCITKGDATTSPKFFGCNTEFAYQSTRSAFPGETGMRNHFRLPGYVNLDMGLAKSFVMPYNEGHTLQLRWEVFNVTNTQRLGGLGGTTSIVIDPLTNDSQPPGDWWNLTDTQKAPGANTAGRVMQIGFRFQF